MYKVVNTAEVEQIRRELKSTSGGLVDSLHHYVDRKDAPETYSLASELLRMEQGYEEHLESWINNRLK
jgi:hypothetical protein